MTSTASLPNKAPATVSSQLKNEFQYYLDNQVELAAQYFDKFLVIKDQKIIGVYDSPLEAYTESSKDHRVGTFLIQHCLPGTQAYTATYHSLVL